jgi:hypothetical protein
MTIRKLEGASALSTLHAVMGAKSPLDEMPISDVRRIGRSNNLARSAGDNERIERALAELAAVPVANDAPKAAFVVRARNESSIITEERTDRRPAGRPKNVPQPTTSGSLGIASFIAADDSPPNWLVDGLQEILERLLAGLHPKKRLSTEVRAEMCRVEPGQYPEPQSVLCRFKLDRKTCLDCRCSWEAGPSEDNVRSFISSVSMRCRHRCRLAYAVARTPR